MIDDKLYQTICKTVPIPTVDVVLVCESEILLVKRRKEPAYGMWWTVGGRQELNETMEDTARRKLREEVGIYGASIIGSIGSVDIIFKERHNVTSVILATISKKPVIVLDENHSDCRWIRNIQDLEYCHPCVEKILNYYFRGL